MSKLSPVKIDAPKRYKVFLAQCNDFSLLAEECEGVKLIQCSRFISDELDSYLSIRGEMERASFALARSYLYEVHQPERGLPMEVVSWKPRSIALAKSHFTKAHAYIAVDRDYEHKDKMTKKQRAAHFLHCLNMCLTKSGWTVGIVDEDGRVKQCVNFVEKGSTETAMEYFEEVALTMNRRKKIMEDG
tara:strand:+ start:4832 stop:5395 length:564 start_codon:yes stop_codon:yes gene_type:complete